MRLSGMTAVHAAFWQGTKARQYGRPLSSTLLQDRALFSFKGGQGFQLVIGHRQIDAHFLAGILAQDVNLDFSSSILSCPS